MAKIHYFVMYKKLINNAIRYITIEVPILINDMLNYV